jgi:GH15 family glucan-1,4-alpha-glucosidase
LLIVALLNYAQRAGYHEFAKAHWTALKRSAFWLESYALEDDGLLHQSSFADWADSVARAGRILYSNVVYWKGLHDLATAAARYGFVEDQARFEIKAQQIKQSINDHFWRDDLGYYVTSQIFDNLSSSGNLLAVAWGMTTPQQAHSILDKMNEFDMANPVPTRVVQIAYPAKFIALENRLGGVGHYHTYAAWLWLGAWHVIALTRMNRLDEANKLLYRIAKVIVRDNAVHEVYDPDGHYLSTFWYTSEAPLTWSAGMVVYAYHVYQRWAQNLQNQ